MINLVVGIELLFDRSATLDRLFPISTVCCGILTGIVYLAYFIPKLNFIIKTVIHLVSVILMVSLNAFIFNWVNNIKELLPIYVIVIIIYIIVWTIMYLIEKKDAKLINEALYKVKDIE